MIDRPPFPARFRRRITVAFVVVAGLSAGALAIGAGVTVYSYRTSSFEERARDQVRDDVGLLAAGAPPLVVAGRLADAEQPGGPAVVVVIDGEVVSSVETLDLSDVPRTVRTAAVDAPGELVEGHAELRSGSTLVIGTIDPQSGAEAYYFFPSEELDRSLRELLVTLLLGWLLVVAVAGFVGTLIARRTLRPVRTAADAARSVAEGLLDTRLPVQSGDEFGEWAMSFNEMVGALEQKIDALAAARDREQRFAADVAHDLRTPIAAVLTAASHLATQDVSSPDDTREAVGIILDAARRLDRLTAELLELHRLEAGQEAITVESVDVALAVRRALAAHGWTEHVRVDTGSQPVVVETDRRRLDRILVNLIGNAMTHGGGDVVVEIAPAGTGARITVADRGPGIAPGAIDHIFERHFKASTHRGGGNGSGLGLSIARESAELLGGRLEVRSAATGGAAFSLSLPDRPVAPGPAAP